MALSQADLDAIDRAITGGTLEVQMSDRRVRYRSMDELLAARKHVAAQLAAASSAASGCAGPRRFTFSTLRGE